MFQSVAVAVICHVFLVGPTETKSNETICKCLPRCNLRRPTHTHTHILVYTRPSMCVAECVLSWPYLAYRWPSINACPRPARSPFNQLVCQSRLSHQLRHLPRLTDHNGHTEWPPVGIGRGKWSGSRKCCCCCGCCWLIPPYKQAGRQLLLLLWATCKNVCKLLIELEFLCPVLGADGATNMATWFAYEMSQKEETAAGREAMCVCVLTETP